MADSFAPCFGGAETEGVEGPVERLEIEVFLALAEQLHFGRAAERVGTSTARVSQLISKIEQSLGVPLFERSSRRVALTPAGSMLENELRPAWQRVLEAIDRVEQLGSGLKGTVVVSLPNDETSALLQEHAEQFEAHYPDCEIRLRKTRSSDQGPWLQPGTVDMALIEQPNTFRGLVSSGPVLRDTNEVVWTFVWPPQDVNRVRDAFIDHCERQYLFRP